VAGLQTSHELEGGGGMSGHGATPSVAIASHSPAGGFMAPGGPGGGGPGGAIGGGGAPGGPPGGPAAAGGKRAARLISRRGGDAGMGTMLRACGHSRGREGGPGDGALLGGPGGAAHV